MREGGKKIEEFIPECKDKDEGGVKSEAMEICCLEQKKNIILLKQKWAKVGALRNSSVIKVTTIICE